MSQFGAGGFLPNTSPYGGSQASPGGTVRKATDQALRPLTLRQCLAASQMHSDAELMIDNVEVSQMTVVATVISLVVQTTNIVLNLDDGTARMEARHWVDSTDQEEMGKWGDIEENKYVRVTGVIKNFGNRRYINATHIRPIKGPNELFFHYLEAMAVRTFHERGNPPKPGEMVTNHVSDKKNTPMSAYSGGGATAVESSASAAGIDLNRLPPLQRKIIECIVGQPRRDDGVHVAAIARGVREDAHKISAALDALMDEGLVFSTIDESHFNVSF